MYVTQAVCGLTAPSRQPHLETQLKHSCVYCGHDSKLSAIVALIQCVNLHSSSLVCNELPDLVIVELDPNKLDFQIGEVLKKEKGKGSEDLRVASVHGA